MALSISADEYLKVYRGSAKIVFARDIHGRRIQFPAQILQRYVTREGVRGVFEISFDAAGKFKSIRVCH